VPDNIDRYRITFGDEDAVRFRFLWDGLRLGNLSPRLVPDARGVDGLQIESSARRALEAIAAPGSAADGDHDQRVLIDGGGVVELMDAERRLIVDRGYLVGWRPEWVGAWVDAADWLLSARGVAVEPEDEAIRDREDAADAAADEDARRDRGGDGDSERR
jgi:hypothetical protein